MAMSKADLKARLKLRFPEIATVPPELMQDKLAEIIADEIIEHLKNFGECKIGDDTGTIL